jgi:uroporphyrinogen-III decarboxylase
MNQTTQKSRPAGIEPFDGDADIRRLIATLRGQAVDRVPHFEILIEDLHVENLLGRKAGNTLGVGGNPGKGSEAAESVLRPMYPADYIELCRVIGQDAIALGCLWTPIKQRLPSGSIVLLNDRSLKSRADLERVIWPGAAEVEHTLDYVREYVAAAKGTGVGVTLCGCAIWQTLYEFAVGLEDCMVMMLDDPEFFHELMERSADHYVEVVRGAVDAGIDIFYPADDFAFNKGMFVEPRCFEQMWRPHYDRILAPARGAGIPIWFHSDGRIDEAMEMLLAMGVDCISPLDPSGIDFRDYKKRFGHRVALHGNIDITWPLVKGTPDDVRRDVREHMDAMKPGGRYVAGSSHSIVNFIPHENFLAMVNAIHEYGRY